MKKTQTARKVYKCDSCEKVIDKGDKYERQSLRIPRFDKDGETQIGIEYMEFKTCMCCIKQQEIEIEELNKIIETKEYKYWASMQEHRYP